jgi:hypothetical protein
MLDAERNNARGAIPLHNTNSTELSVKSNAPALGRDVGTLSKV